MHRRLPLVLLFFLLVPTAAAGPATIDLVADSPLELMGSVRVISSGLLLYHRSGADDDLVGRVYGGVVRETSSWPDCDGDRTEETRELMTATFGQTPTSITINGAKDLVAVYAFSGSGEVRVAETPATADDGTTPSLLGPNPYTRTSTRSTESQAQNAHVAPASPFLVVPGQDAAVTAPGLLSVVAGAIDVIQSGETRTLSPHSKHREISCGSGLPFPQTYSRTVTVAYEIRIDNGLFSARQEGVQRARDAFAGETEPSNHVDERGTGAAWSSAELGTAWTDLGLPSTFFAGPALATPVDGFVKALNPTATITDDAGLKEVRGSDVRFFGNLNVAPNSTSEDGRRMSAHVTGDVFGYDVPTPKAKTPWDRIGAGIGAGAIGLGLFAYAWPSLKFRSAQLLFVPLYARLKKDEVLENELRDDILIHVQEEPGISASELGRRVVCGWGTLVYHLTVLERMRLVSSTREGRHRRYFAQGRINYSDKGAVALLANPAARNILDAIRATPGVIQKDLSQTLRLSPGTVAWHVERLAAQGLVVKEDEGRTVRYFPSDRLLELTRQLAA